MSADGDPHQLRSRVDVNINPKNPVIGTRSFGDSPELVARCAVAYAQGSA